MSIAGQKTQQLQQDIQHELTIANLLLRQISVELEQIKNFTSPGGEFEATIKNNASLLSTLANIQHIDLAKVPQMVWKHTDLRTQAKQNNPIGEQNESVVNDSQ